MTGFFAVTCPNSPFTDLSKKKAVGNRHDEPHQQRGRNAAIPILSAADTQNSQPPGVNLSRRRLPTHVRGLHAICNIPCMTASYPIGRSLEIRSPATEMQPPRTNKLDREVSPRG